MADSEKKVTMELAVRGTDLKRHGASSHLGPSSYPAPRFGQREAQTKPRGLSPALHGGAL